MFVEGENWSRTIRRTRCSRSSSRGTTWPRTSWSRIV